MPGRQRLQVGEAAEAAVRHPAAVEVKGPDSLWALNSAVALLGAERFDVLETFLTRALSVVRARGSAPGFALISTHLGRLANRLGDPRSAEAETRAALESGALSGFYRFATSSVLMRSLIEQGRIDEAQAIYATTGIGEQMPDPRPMTPLLIVRGELRRAQGELDRAAADLRESLARIGRYADRTSAGLDARLLLAETLHELGRNDDALQEAADALRIARAWDAARRAGRRRADLRRAPRRPVGHRSPASGHEATRPDTCPSQPTHARSWTSEPRCDVPVCAASAASP